MQASFDPNKQYVLRNTAYGTRHPTTAWSLQTAPTSPFPVRAIVHYNVAVTNGNNCTEQFWQLFDANSCIGWPDIKTRNIRMEFPTNQKWQCEGTTPSQVRYTGNLGKGQVIYVDCNDTWHQILRLCLPPKPWMLKLLANCNSLDAMPPQIQTSCQRAQHARRR